MAEEEERDINSKTKEKTKRTKRRRQNKEKKNIQKRRVVSICPIRICKNGCKPIAVVCVLFHLHTNARTPWPINEFGIYDTFIRGHLFAFVLKILGLFEHCVSTRQFSPHQISMAIRLTMATQRELINAATETFRMDIFVSKRTSGKLDY